MLSNEGPVEPRHRAIARLPHSRAARTRHTPSHRASCVIAMMRIEIPAFQELALGFARSEVERIGAAKVWPLSICRGTKFQPCGNRPDPAFSTHRFLPATPWLMSARETPRNRSTQRFSSCGSSYSSPVVLSRCLMPT